MEPGRTVCSLLLLYHKGSRKGYEGAGRGREGSRSQEPRCPGFGAWGVEGPPAVLTHRQVL